MVEIIFISIFGFGSSYGKRYKLSLVVVRGIVKCLCVIIKNSNVLCCVFVIVIMKVYVDGGEDGCD